MDVNNNVRPRGTDGAKVIQVIETIPIRGSGIDTDPVRAVKQLWSLEGELIAENDPFICEEYEKLSQLLTRAEREGNKEVNGFDPG